VGVKLVAETNKPVAVGDETSDENHSLERLTGEGKHMPLEDLCTSTEVPGGQKSNITVEIPQNVSVSADGTKMASNTEHATFVEDGSSSKDLNQVLACKSQAGAPKTSGRNNSSNEELFNHSKERHKAQDASIVEDCSQTSHNRELEDSGNPRATASVVLEPKSSRNPIRAELERSKTKPFGNDNIQSTKPVALTAEKVTPVRGGCSVNPIPSKVADNRSDRSSKPSERAGSTANNLATSLKKIVRQQTASKVVRHYPSELVNN
jgi:ubiquitin carboxyl-terminal hydrolase 36/42